MKNESGNLERAGREATLEDAVILAAMAHRGQVDKAGAPYICHPLRLMLSMASPAERIVALLHDTIEDTDVSLESLRASGYNEEVVQAIDLLTHRNGVDYFEYVARIKTNPLATVVKLADLGDNMNVSRIAKPTAKDKARIEKYRKAVRLLES